MEQIIFEPKLIDISNVKCISMTGETTYFLTNDGLIYFCGIANHDDDQHIFQIPNNWILEKKFESLHLINKSVTPVAISDGNIHKLEYNLITKTEFKTIFDYYTKEQKITDKTVYMSEDVWAEKEPLFTRKHFEIVDKLDSGTFGQVFKVKHQLDQQFYAIKCIDLPGTQLISKLAIYFLIEFYRFTKR